MRIWLKISVLLSLSVTPAQATVTEVFNSISGGTYSAGGAYTGYVPVFNSSGTAAEFFYTPVSGYIDRIVLSAYLHPAGIVGSVQIFSDEHGFIGSLIETLPLSYEGTSSGSYAVGSYASGATLRHSTSYWVVMSGPAQQDWNFMTNLPARSVSEYFGEASGDVPIVLGGNYYGSENATSALGMIVDIASGVPESPTSAMTILGFCGLGIIVRRRGRGIGGREAPPTSPSDSPAGSAAAATRDTR